jgi:hypothetical protein
MVLEKTKGLARIALLGAGIAVAGNHLSEKFSKVFGEAKNDMYVYENQNLPSQNVEYTLANNIVPIEHIPKVRYSFNELKELQKVLYAEAANQSSENRRLIAQCILNRVESPDYPNSVNDVIYQKNAFSCINGRGSNLWNQANGNLFMNPYEKRIFESCGADAQLTLEGENVGISLKEKIIAYHDISITKPHDPYWNSLEKVFESERLIFYAPRE